MPGNGECLIKVRAVGVCHTDLHVMKDEVKFPIPAVMGMSNHCTTHQLCSVTCVLHHRQYHIHMTHRYVF